MWRGNRPHEITSRTASDRDCMYRCYVVSVRLPGCCRVCLQHSETSSHADDRRQQVEEQERGDMRACHLIIPGIGGAKQAAP